MPPRRRRPAAVRRAARDVPSIPYAERAARFAAWRDMAGRITPLARFDRSMVVERTAGELARALPRRAGHVLALEDRQRAAGQAKPRQ